MKINEAGEPNMQQLVPICSSSPLRANSECLCRACELRNRMGGFHMSHCVPWFHRYRKHDSEDEFVVDSLEKIKLESVWHGLEVQGQAPFRRCKHAAVVVGHRMFLMGGYNVKGTLNDIQELHVETCEWREWSVPQSGDAPPCAGHNLFFWDKKLLVVGGAMDFIKQVMAIYAFDLETCSWSGLNAKGDAPMARTGQSIVHVGSALIMFGGEDIRGQLQNNVYIFDLKSLAWLRSGTTGRRPSARKGHTAVCYGRRYLWIFGGKSRSSYLNDVHCLDLRRMEWIGTRAKGSVVSRAGHASTVVGDKWYIVGGECSGKEVIGTVVFHFPSQTWSVVTTVSLRSPLANDGISVVAIHHRGRIYLMAYGGHGLGPSNQVHVMLLPVYSNNDTAAGFQLVKTSGFRSLVQWLLSGGKASRRQIVCPDFSRAPTDDGMPRPSTAEMGCSEVARSSTNTLPSFKLDRVIDAFFRDQKMIENKVKCALDKLSMIQKDLIDIRKSNAEAEESKLFRALHALDYFSEASSSNKHHRLDATRPQGEIEQEQEPPAEEKLIISIAEAEEGNAHS